MSPPQAYAKDILDQWKAQFELYYISARGNNVYDTTREWFKREAIPYDHIELIGSHIKLKRQENTVFTHFLKISMTMQSILHEELDIPVILFDTPYNRKPIPDGVIRVS